MQQSPLHSYRFLVNIIGPTSSGIQFRLGFARCSGIGVALPPFEYQQGGFNVTTSRMPTQANSPEPLVLSRGVAIGTGVPQLFEWVEGIYYFLQGIRPPGAVKGKWDCRKTVDVQVLAANHTGSSVPVKLWVRLYNAWPVAFSYSELDATGNAVLIEQLSLTYEGFRPSFAKDNYAGGAKIPSNSITRAAKPL